MSKNTKKKPMTTEDFFYKICGILREKDMMPDILDYALPTFRPVPITTYEFDLRTSLAYGGSEGIYLDIWIERSKGGKKCVEEIGIFKTLREDREGMHIMAGLLADFIVEEWDYVNSHLDDFTWEGADVHPIDDSGKRLEWGYSRRSMESALKKKNELLQKYPQVVVRDNAARTEIAYSKE